MYFEYVIPDNQDVKFFFDGARLYADTNFGSITFFNQLGSKEIYDVERMEIHFPAEHMITRFGNTPRFDGELQIHHKLRSTTLKEATDNTVLVRQAVVAIPLQMMEFLTGNDIFLDQFGISSKVQ